MPVLRYFLYVGAALIAVMFAINAYAPPAPAPMQANAPGFDRTTIRITSNRVTEAPIIYDTSQPTIAPPAQVAASKPSDTVDASSAAKTDSVKPSDARVEAMAQIDTAKPVVSKPKPKPRKVARHDPQRQQYYAQRQAWAQPSFFPGFFGFR